MHFLQWFRESVRSYMDKEKCVQCCGFGKELLTGISNALITRVSCRRCHGMRKQDCTVTITSSCKWCAGAGYIIY